MPLFLSRCGFRQTKPDASGGRSGTLEPGKEAAPTIFEGELYPTDPEMIMTISVSDTWGAGKRKFG